MNREEARQLLPIIQAFAEGKTVQCRPSVVAPWNDLDGAVNFLYGPGCYRIKPEPRLRPWRPEECPLYFMVLHKSTAQLWVACKQLATDHVRVFGGTSSDRAYGMLELFGQFLLVKEDGTVHPCGVMEGEP